MKKTVFIILSFSTIALATEFQYGKGTFSMEGGFLGLKDSIDADIDSYSVVNRHSNLGKFFYGYDLTWYDSDTLKQKQQTYNDYASSANSMFPNSSIEGYSLTVPAVEHRFKGLDANLMLGYDVVHQNQDNFLGLGVLVGISVPVLDSDSSDDDSSDSDTDSTVIDSETEIKTYKIGVGVNFQKSFGKNVSIYGTGSYAYQTGTIENDEADADYSVNGTFQQYNIGLYFTPFTEKYQWGWLTLSPRIYATLGYKYSRWDVDEMVINLTGEEINSEALDPFATELKMDTSVGYFGIGYSF